MQAGRDERVQAGINEQPRRTRILVFSAGAFVLATLVLLLFVLPAEYGWDPLGSGAALGLMGLSAEEQQLALRSHDAAYSSDTMTFELSPFEFVEYGYRLEEGERILYSWHASGEVLYNLHSQPDGMAADYAQSFARGRSVSRSGSYTAAFPGTHGWYWQNRGREDITLTLTATGFFTWAEVSSESGSNRREPGSQP